VTCDPGFNTADLGGVECLRKLKQSLLKQYTYSLLVVETVLCAIKLISAFAFTQKSEMAGLFSVLLFLLSLIQRFQ